MVKWVWYVLSLAFIVALAFAAKQLATLNPNIEFPIWAAGLGLIAGNLPFLARFKSMVKTELFIKTGLVLLGASVNFAVIVSVGWRGMVQALIGVPLVFFFTWWLAKQFKIDEKLRAVLASALSICGVSAAIASAGAVQAKREHLTYTVALVTLFALPLMVIVPFIANAINLEPAVAGAWIGNNIDTTAAVTGAAKMVSEEAVKIASIVKMSQNVLIGLAAFLLATWYAVKVKPDSDKPKVSVIWRTFPKFVLGFIAVSLLVSFGVLSKADASVIGGMKNWFFAVAFVCIGMGFSLKEVKQVGGRPLAVFAIATVFNTVTALILANLLFGG